MDAKLITGFLLWFCFIASVLISQTDSISLSSRQRFRRQNDESVSCPDGTKPCKDDSNMCVTYCNGNPECADGSDEIDCVAGETTAQAAADAVTTQEATSGEAQSVTAVPGDGTTVVLADGTTAVLVDGDATTAAAAAAAATDDATATVTAADDGTTAAAAADDATTGAADGDATTSATGDDATASVADGATTGAAVADDATTVAGATESGASEATAGGTTAEAATEAGEGATTATGATAEEGADTMTSVKPENGHQTDAENGTTSASEDTTSVEGVSDQTATVQVATIDSNASTVADNETATEIPSDVSTASGMGISTESDKSLTTVIDGDSTQDHGNQTEIMEETTTAAPAQPPSGGRVELRVVVSPEILPVQRGRTYEITCTVYGADASTTIYWIQEEPERRYALIDAADANDKQITMSQVSLRARITLDDPSKIGKYTCMAQDATGNSGAAILTMEEGRPYYPQQPGYPPVIPGPGVGQGYLRIVAPDMVEGDYVEIQCEGAAPQDEARIQWFFNNRLLNDEQPLYPRGKTLHIRPISRPYLGNYRCSIPGSSYADANSVLTFGGPVPSPSGPYQGASFTVSVDIIQGQTAPGQTQEGSQVILRCRASEQATGYRWTFTSSQGRTDRGYSEQLVVPRATAQDSGVYTCQATNTRGQSSSGSVNLYITAAPTQPVTGRCSIDEATCRNGRCIPRAYLYDGKNDCGDNSDEAAGSSGASGDSCQPNEIHCTNSDRGRKCVQKFWMCDGDRDCDDGSDEEQRYCDLLPRQRYCKPSEFHCGGSNATTPNAVCIPRSFQCDGYNDCPDRSDEIGCIKPIVVSAPQRQIQVNVGQTLTIQCTARGSPAPYINWRLNWGSVCGDGSDNGRCSIAQTLDANDQSLVIGTLTVRNVNTADGGAYSCEALNNQGFIFAIPDAIVDVIIDSSSSSSAQQCNCNGHSSYCSPIGQCLNCQHNTAGQSCEFCAPGYQGDARRGTPYDCQPIPLAPSTSRCNSAGTHMERGGRCICKYNVEGDRCDQCKRSHFYLNPTTPNGCLPCFCSGVSSECTSTDWRRQPIPLSLSNWNVVPKNFATDSYEARNNIQQRNDGREIAVDQSSLGRPANEVLYWRAPKEALGNFVTLYDGNIDVHFTNDGNDNEAPSNDEFIWLRGNNIDLVHKLPLTQRFKANTNATYSVPINERTFTRKDGTYIDRDNILMALSDLDTLLVKINPIGGRRTAVLRGITLNVAAREGYADTAPTVESCRCPANYTGSSCEKCAEGYGRPHPLVGIYLGQCWSCRSLCNDRSDRCDRESGKCLDCQANSEGDRCERCRPGYILDPRLNQCVRPDQYAPYPSQPYGPGSKGAYYVDQRPYDTRGTTPLTIVLDGSQSEQRVPLQVLNAQPQSVVWGRTDGSPLPPNVIQEGSDLVFRNPSAEQAGNYICTITHPDGSVERIAIYLDYRPGQRRPYGAGYAYPVFSPPSPLTVNEGETKLIQPQGTYYRVYWRREGSAQLPAGVSQNGNGLQISGARPDQSGTYYCELYGADGTPTSVPYEVRVLASDRPHAVSGGQPRISIEPKTINLKEGQRMIVQYTVSSQDPIEVVWRKLSEQGFEPIPTLFNVEPNRLVLNRATSDAAGVYQVVVRNQHGEDRQELRINVEPRRSRGREQQAGAPRIRFAQERYDIGRDEVIDIVPTITGASGVKATWSKDGSAFLPDSVIARPDGSLRVEGRSNNIGGQYTLEVTNAYGRITQPIFIQWRESSNQPGGYGFGQDNSRSYMVVRLESRDEQSHQLGRDIHLQCSVQGSVERPYEYIFSKDGQALDNNVEVHPNGLIIVRNAQAKDAGRYRCEVSFPRAPGAGTQESSFDLQFEGASAGAHSQGYQYGAEYQSQGDYVEVTVEPSEANLERGEKANLTCRVKGAQQYTITWTKYAHDTSLPSYARQQGNSVILNPADDSPAEQMYLQCSVSVPGQPQPYLAYAPFTLRVNDELRKKKKRRS